MEGPLPRLDLRLKTVARHIRAAVHADVGSDHGHLVKALLASGRIEFGIAIENKSVPLENSRRTLAGSQHADVRLGSGLEPLAAGEADSLSLCGLGGQTIAGILDAHPDRVPPRLVAQPNKRADLVRHWCLRNRWHLTHELIVPDRRRHEVLVFDRSDCQTDPAYDGLDMHAALWFGPTLIANPTDEFLADLERWQTYYRRMESLSIESAGRLEAIERVMGK